MANVIDDLRNALEPRQPYYALNLDPKGDDIEVAVYSADTHDRTFEGMVTRSYAETLLEGAARYSIDGDGVEYEEFVNALRAPPMAETVLTASVGDVLDIILTALDREGQARVSIDGANWLVTR